MIAPFTHGNPDLIAKAKAESIQFYGMAGRGATAPGAVVIRHLPHNEAHPYVVHFANTQLGGYHGGEYCETLEEAKRRAVARAVRYDPDGGLNAAYRRHH